MSKVLCTTCNTEKPTTEFYKNSKYRVGYKPRCKKCTYKYYREKIYPKMKLTEKYKESHRQYREKYRLNNPEKIRAHRLAQKAIPSLKSCERCGDTGRLHRHHPDYSKPLEVLVLCVPFHEIAHHGIKE